MKSLAKNLRSQAETLELFATLVGKYPWLRLRQIGLERDRPERKTPKHVAGWNRAYDEVNREIGEVKSDLIRIAQSLPQDVLEKCLEVLRDVDGLEIFGDRGSGLHVRIRYYEYKVGPKVNPRPEAWSEERGWQPSRVAP